jgi:electron transfer flavoprotein alpha subunit
MDAYKGILLCGELDKGKLAPITFELLGIGRKLANELGQELGILLIGGKIGDLAQEAIAYGADKVYVGEAASLEQYNSDAYTMIAANLCRKVMPDILLLGQTDGGRDMAPRLAGRLGGALAMDCLELAVDKESKLLRPTRPVFGGNALATLVSKGARPQMATVRSRTMAPAERDAARKGEVVLLDVAIDPLEIKIKVVEQVEEKAEGVKLEDAQVVVSGGRGIGSAENFKMLWDLARVFDGAVGGTRAACEQGWLPMTHQVGQTGKIVSPKLYIAVALSGAMQHIAGCSGSKCIVAINKDPEANIFKVAQYGIVGDFKDAVPGLTEKFKELLAR